MEYIFSPPLLIEAVSLLPEARVQIRLEAVYCMLSSLSLPLSYLPLSFHKDPKIIF